MALSVHPTRAVWMLRSIVVASGFAGLGYEMVWTRLLSVALGTDMMAVLGSIAGFFAGLAVGAFLLDGPIRRARAPWKAYALLEAVIGVWGLASIGLLPAAARILPPVLGTHPAPLLLWAASFALPAITLLPATVAMGGTLTALERLFSGAGSDVRCSAGVYAANTAGAVAGTLASAFLLFPALGLTGTLMLLAGVNAVCACAALVWGREHSQRTQAVPDAAPPLPLPERPRTNPRLALTLFSTGLLGIAAEVLVVRLAAQALQDTIYTFAGLLSAYLAGTALGGGLYQRFSRRATASSLGTLLMLTSLACLATAALSPFMRTLSEQSARFGVAGELAVALILFLLPSAAMGALFGYLLQRVRDERGSVGWAVGINSAGAAFAPALASLLLVPTLGAFRALVLVASGYLVLMPIRRNSLGWVAVPALCAGLQLLLPAPTLIRMPSGGSLLALREGPMMTASVVEDAGGVRYLEINGHFRMGGTSSMRSDYRQAMLPLLLHPAPHHALFLGVGTGATLVGGARMPELSVRGVELSPEAVELLPWFTDTDKAANAVPITVGDARRFVAADHEHYDVIIADLFHPALDGSGALYTTEHFSAVKKRLAPGGLFCQWLPLYQLDEPSLRAIIRTFLAVYPHGSAWLNHYSVRTPMLALVAFEGEGRIDVDALAAKLRTSAIAKVSKPLGFEKPMDVLGQFVAGPRALAALVDGAPLNTDDRPFVALDARRNVQALSAPPADLLIRLIRAVRPDPTDLPSAQSVAPEGRSGRLTAYWRARDRFLEAGAALPGDPRGMALVEAASPGLLDAIHISEEFDPAYQPLLGMARALLASDRSAALRLLREISAAAPGRTEAQALLMHEATANQGLN